MSVETIGQARSAGWRAKGRCLGRDASTKKGTRPCLQTVGLDMDTLVWTRGRDFSISMLSPGYLALPTVLKPIITLPRPPAQLYRIAKIITVISHVSRTDTPTSATKVAAVRKNADPMRCDIAVAPLCPKSHRHGDPGDTGSQCALHHPIGRLTYRHLQLQHTPPLGGSP